MVAAAVLDVVPGLLCLARHIMQSKTPSRVQDPLKSMIFSRENTKSEWGPDLDYIRLIPPAKIGGLWFRSKVFQRSNQDGSQRFSPLHGTWNDPEEEIRRQSRSVVHWSDPLRVSVRQSPLQINHSRRAHVKDCRKRGNCRPRLTLYLGKLPRSSDALPDKRPQPQNQLRRILSAWLSGPRTHAVRSGPVTIIPITK